MPEAPEVGQPPFLLREWGISEDDNFQATAFYSIYYYLFAERV